MGAKQTDTKRRGLLLYSGGLDSTISALILATEAVNLVGLSIDYPGRPHGEKLAVKAMSGMLPFSQVIEVSFNSNGLLTDSDYLCTSLEGWIPYRNLLFWSIAAHKAILLDADFVAGGHDEFDGTVFNDASKDFFACLRQIVTFSGNNNRTVNLELPILSVTDEHWYNIVNADKNKELFRKTWSCWRDSTKPCNHCYACTKRETFFDELEESV